MILSDRVSVTQAFTDGSGETSLAQDVRDGLTRPFKELAPKHLYDERGALLFDQICEQPEYYPTRTERVILEDQAAHIARTAGVAELIELGSGTAAKTRVLLDALVQDGSLVRYVPIDVTASMVRECATQLTAEYPRLAVHGVVGDFERHLDHIPPPLGPRLFVFLGGTLGNFPPPERGRFLAQIADFLTPEDFLLLGTDLIKARPVLRAAYDDAAGVTAEFNRNILRVINRELGADFDPESFEHVAVFDERHEWIEMRLRATTAQLVTIRALDLQVSFKAGEEIRTEISTKFTRPKLERDLAGAGLELADWLTDADEQFAVSLSRLATAG